MICRLSDTYEPRPMKASVTCPKCLNRRILHVDSIADKTQIAKGAVLSVGLFFVTMVITFLQFVILDRRVHYGDE